MLLLKSHSSSTFWDDATVNTGKRLPTESTVLVDRDGSLLPNVSRAFVLDARFDAVMLTASASSRQVTEPVADIADIADAMP